MADLPEPPELDFTFDTAGARKAGFTDADIAATIAPQAGFDLEGARKAGFTDSQIVDWLAPEKTPAPKTEPEPQSGTLLGIGKAVAQTVPEVEGRVVSSFGRMVQSAGTAMEASPVARRQIGIMDQIDTGADLGAFKDLGQLDRLFARQYQLADEGRRQEMRQEAINTIAEPPSPIAESTKRVGGQIAEAGKKIEEFGPASVPLTEEEEGRFSVKTAKILTNLAGYVGAAALTGLGGVISMGGVEAFGHTYDDAKAKGASDEEAAKAAFLNGAIQGGLNAVPAHRAMEALKTLPKALQGDVINAVGQMAASSGTLVAFTQFAQLIDNAVAKNTYDPDRPLTQGLGENLAETAVAGAIPGLPAVALGGARRLAGRQERPRPTPEQVGDEVMKAETVDDAIATARRTVDRAEVADFEIQASEFGGRAEAEQGAVVGLFGRRSEGEIQQNGAGAWFYRSPQGEDIPLRAWDGTQREDTIPTELAQQQRDVYGRMGYEVVYLEHAPGIDFDGVYDPARPNTLFLSASPERNVAEVAGHELTHAFEGVGMPDGRTFGDFVYEFVRENITAEGRQRIEERGFARDAPQREAFAEGPEGDAAHAAAVERFLFSELGADIGGEAPKFPTFVKQVVDQVEARYGKPTAARVLKDFLGRLQEAMTRLRDFFFKPEDMAEYGVVDTKSQDWVTNIGLFHAELSKVYAEKFGTRAEAENARLGEMRVRAERDRLQQSRQEPQRLLPPPAIVTPPPRPEITPENVFRPETYGRPGSTAPVRSEASLEGQGRPPEAIAPARPVEEAQPSAEPPVAAPEPVQAPSVVPFEQRLREGKEAVWADRSVMGRVQRGLPRNEQFATDVARERIMREDAAPLIRRALEEDGIPEGDIPEIARLYRQEDGEPVEAAFDRAVDRWVTKREAEGFRIDADVEAYDMLKAEKGSDPLLEEAFARLEEMYTGRARELPGDENVPLGSDEASRAPAGAGEEAAPPSGRSEGAEGGGRPGGRGPLAGEADAELGPKFSPRRTDTEPPGPTLIDTREASPEELAARQRRQDKSLAEAAMRGRKVARKPQESAEDTPLFGGERQRDMFGEEAPPKPKQGALFSPREPAPPFYSAVIRGVENLKIAKATPGQWEATLRNMPGIKAEERQWIGLDDWLRQQPKSVTKEEVLDFLRANQVQVQEVVRGGEVPKEAVADIQRWLRENDPDVFDEYSEADWAKVARGNANSLGDLEGFGVPAELLQPIYDNIGGGATKYSTYTLPGGERYRELLLTLPMRGETGREGPAGWAETNNARAREGAADYRSPHWDEANVLAHVRFDDRTGPNGEKILHIAEVQSDWHQAGRKRGYLTNEVRTRMDEITARLAELSKEYRANIGKNAERRAEITQEADRLREEERRLVGAQIPDAPFKTTWPEFAMKRMIRWASEHGYDRVSWDTGKTNAERYDLSKQIGRLEWTRSGSSGFTPLAEIEGRYEGIPVRGIIRAWDHNGREVIDRSVEEGALPDIIGKEAAEKLLNQEPKREERRGTAVSVRQLAGLDLKVGGEGMTAFYDKQLPIIANKIGKKFGAKVEESTVDTGEERSRFQVLNIGGPGNGVWRVRDLDTAGGQYVGAEFASRQEARAWIDKNRPGAAQVHSLPITDAMRRSVVEEGQALFSPRARRLSDYSTGPDGRTLAFEADRAHWMENHERLLAGRGLNDVQVMRTNFILRALSSDRGPITISPRIASAIKAEHPDVPKSVWDNLPELLAEPVFAYPHREGGLNFAIDRRTSRGEPIIVGVREGNIHTITPLHDTADETGMERLARSVLSAADRGEKVYVRTAAFLSQLETGVAGTLGTTNLRRPTGASTGYASSVSRRANLGYASRGSDRQAGGRPGGNVITHDDVIKTQGRTLYSPRSTRQYTPEQRQMIDRVFAKPTTFGEKVSAAREDFWRKAGQQLLDPYIGLKRDDLEGYMAVRLANSSAGALHYFLEQGPIKFTGNALDADARLQNGGANGLIRDLGAEAGDFMKWVVGNRAERLKAEDRERLLSADDIRAAKSLNKGRLDEDYILSNGQATRSREAAYLDALKRLDAINRNVMDLTVEGGLVKRETADALIANPFYVPFYRAAVDNASRSFAGAQLSPGMVRQYAFKKLKGEERQLRDPWENAVGNWEHMIDAAMRNRTAVRILGTASARGLGAVEKVSPQDYHNMTKGEKAKTVWVMEEGQKTYYRVEDPMILTAVSALETASSNGFFMRVGRGFAKTLRYGVTANPLFAARTAIRDTQNAIAISEISANPFKNIADGFETKDIGNRLRNVARAVAGQEKLWRPLEQEEASALAGGALMRLGAWHEGGVDSRNVTSSKKFWRYITGAMDSWKDVVGAAEDINRMAIYRQLREKGLPHDYASFQGRDLQDFTLKGAASWVRTITELTPFLNARAQGMYKIGRAAAESDRSIAMAVGKRAATSLLVRAATVLGAMTVAGLALDAIYHDDEDYKKRTEFDRQTYYWFKVGDTQFRIPKGFELAALSSLAVDGIEVFFDPEMHGQRVVDNFWASLGSNLQVQAPAFAQPALDVLLNTRGTGGRIEPMGSERLQAEQRYTINNTMFARGASEAMNKALRAVSTGGELLSPVQIDYLIDAYTGWLGTNIVGVADKAVHSVTSEPERPAKDFLATLTQGMVRTDPAPQSRYVDMLYKQSAAIERAYNTYRELLRRERPEEAQAHFEANKELISKYPAFSKVKRLEGDLNSQIRQITNSPSMSAEQKRLQIMRLNALKSRAAEGLFSTGARP